MGGDGLMSNTINTFNILGVNSRARVSRQRTNFGVFRGDRIPVNSDTITASDNVHDLGTSTYGFKDMRIAGSRYFGRSGSTIAMLEDSSQTTASAKLDVLINGETLTTIGNGPKFTIKDKNADYSVTGLDCSGFRLLTNDGITTIMTFHLPAPTVGAAISICNIQGDYVSIKTNTSTSRIFVGNSYSTSRIRSHQQGAVTNLIGINSSEWIIQNRSRSGFTDSLPHIPSGQDVDNNEEYTIDTWMNKTGPGFGNDFSSGFNIEENGYMNHGQTSGSNFHARNDEYNPVGNAWTNKTNGSIEAGSRSSFIIDAVGYATGGQTAGSPFFTPKHHSYTPDTWTGKTNAPDGKGAAAGGNADEKGYFYGGDEDGGLTQTGSHYEYIEDSWSTKTSGLVRNFMGYASFDDKIFYFCGDSGTGLNMANNEEYDADTWTAKTAHPNGQRLNVGFTYLGNIYSSSGESTPNTTTGLQQFDPQGNAWSTKSESNSDHSGSRAMEI